jgi:hypothetical protein
MASGLEHYRQAQTSLSLAEDGDRCEPGDPESLYYMRQASVHALLAIAAAIAGCWNNASTSASGPV